MTMQIRAQTAQDRTEHLFTFHKLNEAGIRKAKIIQNLFTSLAIDLDQYMVEGRSKALVWTKLEEASFNAKKAMAMNLENQEGNSNDN